MNKLILTLAIGMLLSTASHAQVANPNVTQTNIKQTICVPGWTKTIRPSYYQMSKIKNKMCTDAKITTCSDYILDHIIPLSVGGDPIALENLQLESKAKSYDKDNLERKTKTEVCAGRLTLARGQAKFNKD
jgi:hypothetical protein